MPVSLTVTVEKWPIAGAFAISRGAKTEAVVVVAALSDGTWTGRGECVPYGRYGETVETVTAAIDGVRAALEAGADRKALQSLLPPGAARNALDCAAWDLAAKQARRSAAALAGEAPPQPCTTAFTISLGDPQAMGAAAAKAAHRPLLKIKLGAEGDAARIAAVREAVPSATLIVDANEGWTADTLRDNFEACRRAGVTLIEQPLPADDDGLLGEMAHPVPVCADESVHGLASLAALKGKYDAINIKLDKTGGLTEALALAARARHDGFLVMAGCMVATSLSMAPAMLIAQHAAVVDLDGPLLLARDRPHGLRYDGSVVHPASSALWG